MTRFLIVGFGRMGRIHFNAVKRMPDAEVSAIVDPTYDAGDISEPIFRCLTDAFSSAAFDACIIASPTKTHAEYGAEFIKRRVPLLIEKPVTGNRHKARELDELQKKHDVPVFVSFTERFNPVIQAALPELKNKIIRSMSFARISHQSQNILSDGLLHDIAVHDIDLARFLTGREIINSSVHEKSVSSGQQFEIILTLQNNISVKIHSAVDDAQKERRFLIETNDVEFEGDLLTQSLIKRIGNSVTIVPVDSSIDAVRRQLTQFNRHIRTGTSSHIAVLHDGIKTLEIIGE